LRIEVARSKKEMLLSKKEMFFSQRKYVLNMFLEAGMLGCRPVDSPAEANSKLLPDQGELLDNLVQYRRLVGKLNLQ